jgi:hypothetical protein
MVLLVEEDLLPKPVQVLPVATFNGSLVLWVKEDLLPAHSGEAKTRPSTSTYRE